MAAVKVVMFDQRWKATITNAQEAILLESLANRFNYQAQVANPAFNSAAPVTPENSPLIDNPLSKQDYICRAMLQDILRDAKLRKLHVLKTEASQQAVEAVEASFTDIALEAEKL